MMNNIGHSEAPIVLKVNVADRGVFEKRFTFKPDEKVWAAKQQVIHEVAGKDPRDIQNYGFFVPPHQGKAGKFMDEGRPLSEYSLPGEDQSLEFMLKRRVYRSISFDESKLTKIHTKVNLKKLIEFIEQNNAGQVNQFLEKGLDPNFQDPRTGETPLTTAAAMDNSTEVIMFLINGGAFMDFRNRAGLTAVHRAAAAGKAHNIKAFLDLGASPNYRDLKGLTPLYHACLSCRNPRVVELLLSDQSDMGVADSQGWQEIHQACRYGYMHHMEQLIYYGADLNAQNGTGNTPLHICSLYNQEDCARLMLYRGARRDVVNFANQTAEMVAVVATNIKLSEFIKNYNEKDVVPHMDKPTYSTRRRTQSKSRPLANSVFLRDSNDTFLFCSGNNSQTSSTPSLQSETSEPLSTELSPPETVPQIEVSEDNSPTRKLKRHRTMSNGSGSDSSYVTDSGDDTGSAPTSPGLSPNQDGLGVRWRTYSLSSLNKEEKGTVPRVKEVKGAANMSLNKKPAGKSHSRKLYEAVKNFTPTQAGELSLTEGDVVEVITKGEKGYWQGTVSGQTGWFPAECVEELKKRKHRYKNSLHKPTSVASSLNKSNTSLDQSASVSPTTPTPEPRQVILNKVKSGFGFQMRGANAPTVNKLEFQPSNKIPALQYIGEVEPGGEAEKSGLKKGDYILEVNGNDIRTASHRHVVSLIRKTGHNLILKVISLDKTDSDTNTINSKPGVITRSNSLPPGAMPSYAGPLVNGMSSSDGSHKEKKPPPIPSRAPTTSLSARTKPQRHSVSDLDFEEPQPISHEDRVISVPRERITSTDNQWHSPLTGHNSLPRRPKSSYGAIIGSTHDSTVEPKRVNYRPVEYLDNTGFMTLPSKPVQPGAWQLPSMDDTSIGRRSDGSGMKDRPKSWMPKVLPTTVPITPPGHHHAPKEQPEEVIRRSSEPKVALKGGDGKKDKKRRFSFKKKKEKDYIAPLMELENDEPGPENGDVDDDTLAAENLHIEDDEIRPSSLPGLSHKRLCTFKPVAIPHHQIHANEAVSPELSQALEKRKTRVGSDSAYDFPPPVFTSPEREHAHPVYYQHPMHMPPAPTEQPPKAKSLEESIRDEMTRRRSNTAPSGSIPTKPRRTFEYRKTSIEESAAEDEAMNVLDLELAKAVAKRAEKMTTVPANPNPIYENINNFKEKEQPSPTVQEPSTITIEEKLKKLHLQDEVAPPPVKFKPPVQPPPATKHRTENSSHPVKAPPPKTLPKPKKKSSSSEPPADQIPANPRAHLTLPLQTDQQLSYQPPPPVLSPEMVATQLLDDIIDEEVKNSNWDTASWIDNDFSTPSPNTSEDLLPPPPTTAPPTTPPQETPTQGVTTQPDGPSPGKKKYVYKITLVTESRSDGSEPVEHPPVITQIVTNPPTTKKYRSTSDPLGSPPPPPPPPPVESPDECATSFISPVFTPPNSPPPPLPQGGSPVSHFPPPVFDSPPQEPPAVLSEPPPVTQQPPPPPVTQPPPPPVTQPPPPPVTQPAPATQPPPPPVTQPPLPPITEPPSGPTTQQQPPPTIAQPPPPVLHEQSTPPVTQEEPPPPTTKDEPPPISQPPPPVVQQPPKSTSQESPPSITKDEPPSVSQPPAPIVQQQPPSLTSHELPPPITKNEPPPVSQPPPPIVQQQKPSPPTSPKELPPPQEPHPPREPPPSQEPPPPQEPPLSEPLDAVVPVIAPPSEYKENTEEPKTEPNIIVPPLAFADPDKPSTGNEVKPTIESGDVEKPVTDQSESVVDDAKPSAKAETTESTGTSSVPGTDVPAPASDIVDNVVEIPAIQSGNTEELAPSKPEVSEDSTTSSTFRDIPFEKWSCAHVCQWLESIGMAEHKTLFEENDIRGLNLIGLQKADLRELGVKKLGHRMTITEEVHTLTTNNNA